VRDLTVLARSAYLAGVYTGYYYFSEQYLYGGHGEILTLGSTAGQSK